MLDKIFDKLPYDALANVKLAHMLLAAMGVVLVVVGAYYFMIYGPAQEEYASLEKKKFAAEDKLQKYQMEVSQKPLITKQVATLTGTLVERKNQLPLPEELPELVNKISDVAEFLGLTILTFKMEPAKTGPFYKEIPVSLTFAGDYYRTAGFFDTLQSLLRLVNISHFKMEIAPVREVDSDTKGKAKLKSVRKLQTKIKANTYAYIEGAEEG